jgi:hypothetical protein
VLVKIQLCVVIFVNKFYLGSPAKGLKKRLFLVIYRCAINKSLKTQSINNKKNIFYYREAGGGFLFNNSDMAYLNTKSQERYLSCGSLQKRYFSTKDTAGNTQSSSFFGGSPCSSWDEENFLQ